MNIDLIDFDALAWMQSLKSNNLLDLQQGLAEGQEIWLFDSGPAGYDDTLLYPAGTTIDQVRSDLEEFFFLQNNAPVPPDLWDRNRPNAWSLEGPFDAEAAARRWPIE